MLAHIPSTEVAKTKIVRAKFGQTTISAALTASALALAITYAESAKADGAMLTKAPPIPYVGSSNYNWNGFYAGGNLGLAWGRSNWTAGPGLSGTNNLFQTIDTFDEAGSFLAGLQGGYNYVLPNRILLGAELDASFPAFQMLPVGVNPFGLSTGGTFNFNSTTLGPVSFAETVLRHRARPRRLRAGELAVLRHRRLRLDIQSTVVDPDRNRQQRNPVVVAIGLGGRSRR